MDSWGAQGLELRGRISRDGSELCAGYHMSELVVACSRVNRSFLHLVRLLPTLIRLHAYASVLKRRNKEGEQRLAHLLR